MYGHHIVQVDAGRNHSIILDNKSDVYACGSGIDGQIGLPDQDTLRTTFSMVLSLMSVNVAQVFAGGLHSFVVLDDIIPKKDDFSNFKRGENQDSPLNSGRDEHSAINSQLDIGSNWNF